VLDRHAISVASRIGETLMFHRPAADSETVTHLRAGLLAFLVLAVSGGAVAQADTTPPVAPTITSSIVDVGSTASTDLGIATNPVSGDVYVADAAQNRVEVFDAAGQLRGSLAAAGPSGVTTTADGSTVWVLSGGTSSVAGAITSFDASTLQQLTTKALPVQTAGCPDDVVAASGVVWIAFRCGGTGHNGVAEYDPGTDTISPNPLALSNLSDQVFLRPTAPGSTTAYAVSTWTMAKLNLADPAAGATVTAQVSLPVECSDPVGAAYEGATDQIAVVCNNDLELFAGSDLTRVSEAQTPGYGILSVAGSAGNLYLGASLQTGAGANVWVIPDGATIPVENFATYTGDRVRMNQWGLAPSADDDHVFALTTSWMPYSAQLALITHPTTPRGIVRVSSGPTEVIAGDPATFFGAFSFSDYADPSGQPLTVTRTNPDGSQTPISDIALGVSGGFSFSDTPTAAGQTSYTISWPGDATHAAASTTYPVSVILPTPGLTLTRSAKNVTYGSAVKLTTRLSAHGANNTVSLYAGQNLVSSAHVDANGQHVFTIKPSATTAYHVAYAGDSRYAARTTAPVTVGVIYRITERMAGGYATKAGYREYHYRASCATRAHTGCPAFTATVAPGMGGKGVDVQFQERIHGGWYMLFDRDVKLSAGGALKLRITYAGKGIEGIPMRIKVGGVPPSRTALSALGTWQPFKVTA
jgi:hypothetical protein